MTTNGLNSDDIDLTRMIERFISERQGDKSKATIYNNKSHLSDFDDWCTDNGHNTVGDLDPFVLLDYKNYVSNRVKKSTLRNYVSTVREFLRFCNRMDLTGGNLVEALEYPDITAEDLSRDTMLDFETIEKIEDYLQKFEYGHRRHVVFGILWHTGCRMGALRSLDVDDYVPADQSKLGVARLKFRHRPEEGTPLKNGAGGERIVNLKPKFATLIEDYVGHHRIDVTDDHGREPLVTTKYGRPALSTIQNQVYTITRPCVYEGSCPHGRTETDCEATKHGHAAKCPSSVSPHPLRRGSITYHIREDGWSYDECSMGCV